MEVTIQQPQLQGPFPSTALYVGDLDPSVTEAQLHDIFSQIGRVISVRVCRDMVTRKSLGYAYVNYDNSQEASRAIEELNFLPINNKAVRIMYSYRDPSIRKSGSGNLFVKNLDKSVDNKTLYELFSPFGKILSCKVAQHDNTNQSKGYGFVQFESEDAANAAVEKLNGTKIMDKEIFVGPFLRRQERVGGGDAGAGNTAAAATATKFSNLFVKNLSDATSDEELKSMFIIFGPISSAVVMREPDGRSKCFGFVNFENPDDAAQAVEEMNGKVVQEREIYVSRAQKKNEREAELKAKFEQERKEDDRYVANLYLKNIDDGVDDDKLRAMFSAFGQVASCKVLRDPQGHSKGSGFVAFKDMEAANRAVAGMNGKMMGNKPLYVAMAQKKEDRKARLEAEFASRGPSNFNQAPPQFMGQQLLYGRAPMQAAYGFQQPMIPGIRAQMPGYFPHRPMPNRPIQFQAPQHMQRGHGPSLRSGDMSILASALASATPENQRIMLGEQLYPLVDRLQHEHAGKITGMLLEMDQTEVLHLLESPDALKMKIVEAMEVLRDAANRLPDLASLTLAS